MHIRLASFALVNTVALILIGCSGDSDSDGGIAGSPRLIPGASPPPAADVQRIQAPTATVHSLAPIISDNGRWVAYGTSNFDWSLSTLDRPPLREDLTLFDRQTGTTTKLLPVTGGCLSCNDHRGQLVYALSMSSDAQHIAFVSGDQTLTPESGSNSAVYIYDRTADTVTLASRTSDGVYAHPCNWSYISADGSRLLFFGVGQRDKGTTIEPGKLFLWERETGIATSLPIGGLRSLTFLSADADLSLIMYTKGVGLERHVYDLDTGVETPINLPNGLRVREASLSADGSTACFTTNSGAEVWTWDRNSGALELEATGRPPQDRTEGGWDRPSLSPDGNVILLRGHKTNYSSSEERLQRRQWYTWHRRERLLTRISTGHDGRLLTDQPALAQPSWEHPASFTADGRTVVLNSFGANWVPNDDNERSDVFLVQLPPINSG